jgi:hypothetical protein
VWGVDAPLGASENLDKNKSRGVLEGNHFDVFYIIGSEYRSFCTNTSP